jgi:hypothetical protein
MSPPTHEQRLWESRNIALCRSSTQALTLPILYTPQQIRQGQYPGAYILCLAASRCDVALPTQSTCQRVLSIHAMPQFSTNVGECHMGSPIVPSWLSQLSVTSFSNSTPPPVTSRSPREYLSLSLSLMYHPSTQLRHDDDSEATIPVTLSSTRGGSSMSLASYPDQQRRS